jgi:hypothetical protein
LIELEFQSRKLNNLDDVLDHISAQCWVESRFRSVSWWEKPDGTKVPDEVLIGTVLKEGIGTTEDRTLQLIIGRCMLFIIIFRGSR